MALSIRHTSLFFTADGCSVIMDLKLINAYTAEAVVFIYGT